MADNLDNNNDKYYVEAAEILANEALHLAITEAIPIYEQLLAIYPTAAKFWKQYVEAQMAVNNDDATKQIFSRCLMICPQVPLWRCYIRFIKKVNEKKGFDGQEETRKAFDYMLNCVGADVASGPVWLEYINFLKSLPARSAQDETHRMTAVRKAYQKAIITPTHNVEQLWKEYENFENSVSRVLAKGLISEFQPKFNSARAVYRERKKYVDEIDWNMLAVPPTGSCKEEQQWMTWKKLLAFEKGNPQRIDSVSSNKRFVFAYEQCLMYLYHYPDIWYDYASWHAKSGSVDSAIKVYQRALKALPGSEMLKYAYAELEESRGAVQPAKKIYESLLGDGVNATALSHIQFIRFLRRSEGVEAARKYFLDARKSPKCTYHVYVAYAMMSFCLDKDPKVAHNIFEAGLKRFMHEPGYILEYADFLSRLNDDRNIRALFERALNSLPPEESVEVWKRFAQFEQTYGDLASMLKVEQRRKEALWRTSDDGGVAQEGSLQEVISRYSFMDLWPCSSKDLDNLARQAWLTMNMNRKAEKSNVPNGGTTTGEEKSTSGVTPMLDQSSKVIYPDITQMMIYEPGQKQGSTTPPSEIIGGLPTVSTTMSTFDGILKAAPPALVAFIANLPAIEGPAPDVDFVLSICLQSNPVTGQASKHVPSAGQVPAVAASGMSEPSGTHKARPAPSGSSVRMARDRQPGKRKDAERQDDDETASMQSAPLPKDAFRLRQLQKAHGGSASQTGSTSYGSAFSGEQSGSTS
ncbi:cleavage stimulation factor subunit 77-like isoform X3 [Chenopodium quinoa]|uniref:cleavage stimulation factor subunit 77-like isoform X1 n=1 Tax=Chenopodium quinoa TaxID=63459 RepID=UPI000B789C73|nr:cleavage stimulation factor subunit 77-like isoform X1 [Chenopodium quinoa]XP_021733244.1 cleavage stimulation factor subunit 77-like isoform X2 [Chenopodium quinoa]XP_021733245.1 cleavage stimulation factor subunit 77-like isoform X3 [Chenopodium quinoa]